MAVVWVYFFHIRMCVERPGQQTDPEKVKSKAAGISCRQKPNANLTAPDLLPVNQGHKKGIYNVRCKVRKSYHEYVSHLSCSKIRLSLSPR